MLRMRIDRKMGAGQGSSQTCYCLQDVSMLHNSESYLEMLCCYPPLNNSRKINNDSSCFGQNGMRRLNSIRDEVIVGNKGCTLHMEYNREQDVSITIRRWYFDDIHTHSPCAQMLVLDLGSRSKRQKSHRNFLAQRMQ